MSVGEHASGRSVSRALDGVGIGLQWLATLPLVCGVFWGIRSANEYDAETGWRIVLYGVAAGASLAIWGLFTRGIGHILATCLNIAGSVSTNGAQPCGDEYRSPLQPGNMFADTASTVSANGAPVSGEARGLPSQARITMGVSEIAAIARSVESGQAVSLERLKQALSQLEALRNNGVCSDRSYTLYRDLLEFGLSSAQN